MKFKVTDWSFLERLVSSIESYLKKEHEKFKHDTVLHEAQTYAAGNYPAEADDSFESCLTTIRGFYSKLKKEISIKLQGGVQKTIGAANMATSNQSIASKESEIHQESEAMNRLVIDRGRIGDSGTYALYKKQRMFLILFAIGECIWTMSAFLKLGDIVAVALCVGVVVGVAQILGVKSAVQVIKEIDDSRKKKFWWIVFIISAFVISFCLALLRYWFVHIGSGATVPFFVMNPFTFVGINMLFIAVTALIVLFNYPTKAQINDISKAQEMDAEILKYRERLKSLGDELTALRKEREFFVELRTRLIHAETKLHEKVNTMFDESVGVFKHENTVKRTDHLFPQSFKNPHQPLSDETVEEAQLLES